MKYDGYRADVFSTGQLLHETLTGRTVGVSETTVLADLSSSLSAGAAALLRAMMAIAPGQRPLMRDVLKDPWVAGDAA